MREHNLVGVSRRRRRRSLTRQDTAAAPAPDLIGRDFTAEAPGQRLVGDITYLPTEEGWVYPFRPGVGQAVCGGSQGLPARASRSASSGWMPWLRAVPR